MKSTYNVLKELKPQWDKMTDSERNALGVTLAGKNQYRVLAAIMQNFNHATEATQTALTAQGSALQENAAYMESLEAKTTRVKALFQDFAQGVTDSDMVKGVLDLAAGLLKIGNTDLGHVITQFTLLSGVLTGIAGMAIKGLGLTTPLVAVLPYIAGAVAAFVGLYNVIKSVQDILQEKEDAKIFDNAKTKIEQSQQTIEDYNNKIKESSDRLQELNKIPFEERTDDINVEIARLEALISTYQQLKEQEEERLRTEGLQALRKTQFSDGYTVETGVDKFSGGGFLRDVDVNYEYTAEQMAALEVQYGSLEEAAYKYAKALDIPIRESDSLDDVLTKLESRGVVLTEKFHDWDKELEQSSYDMKGYIWDLNGAVEPSEKLLKSTEDLLKANKDKYDALKAVESVNGNLDQQEKDFIRNYESLSVQYEKAKVGADNFAKAQKAISEAQEEWKNQRYDATLQDYVNALTNIEGIDTSNVGSMLDILKQTGAISLDYTQEELQQVLDKMAETDGAKAEVEVDANTEAVFDEILSAQEQLESQGITITSSSDADALLNSMNLIQQKIQELSSKPIKVSVTSDMSKALTEANNVTKAVNGIPRSKSVSVNIGVNGLSAVQEAASSIAGVYSKTATLTINVQIRNAKTGQLMDSIPSHYATGVDYFAGGKALINDGAPVNGSSAELVVADGKANIYNNGEPTVVNLPRGAKIYTAAETQEILKNSNAIDNLQAPSFADGNVKIPSEINAQTIVYDTSDYYKQNVQQISKTKDAFDAWQKEKKHLLELDLITQEQYYLDLEYMNENYLKNISGQQDEYWRYQEEIYKWKKSQLVDENELLERQIELEKALQDVAKAKMQKILVYKDGKFQYMADIDAIAEAQRNVSELKAKGYASGTSNATPGLHLVGENGPELRVLNGGDGIIPADATKNLLQIAKMSTEGLSNAFNKTMQNIYNFAIDNLSLPDIKNANEFLDGLKNYAYQYSYANS